MKKFFERISTVLIVFLIFLTAYVISCNARGKVANVFGYSVMKVITGSMEPSIHVGDYILIEKTDTSELSVGDIICFYSDDDEIYNIPNTHRIMKILSNGNFVTKGDANTYDDSVTVPTERVIGIYKGKIRFLRWINSFTSIRKILVLIIIISMSFISAYEIKTIAKLKVQCDEENERRIREAIDIEKAKLYGRTEVENESGKNNEN